MNLRRLCLVAAALSAPSSLWSQEPALKPAFLIEVGLGLGSSNHESFTGWCGKFWPIGVRVGAGVFLSERVFATGTTSRVFNFSPDDCQTADVPRPASQVEVREYPHELSGNGFGAHELQLGTYLIDPIKPLTVRVSGGAVWVPSKRLVGPIVSGDIVLNLVDSPWALAIGIDVYSFRIPYTLEVYEIAGNTIELISSTQAGEREVDGMLRISMRYLHSR